MDVWIVAAAAGAGYVAQHWKSIMRGKKSISDSSFQNSGLAKSSPLEGKSRDKTCPFRKFVHRKDLDKDIPTEEDASTSGSDGEKRAENYEDLNLLSVSGLSTGLLSNEVENFQEGGQIDEKSSDFQEDKPYGYLRNKSIVRARRSDGQFLKPLSSLESCLVAQLYKEHAEMEEYVYTNMPSPSSPRVRPFIVTNGSKMISRSHSDSFKVLKKTQSEENEAVIGIPPLPNVEFMKIVSKAEAGMGKEPHGRLSSTDGSSHGALLFSFGISVGILSSFLANKREVNKLNMLLKQTQSLVQDLQEELEMKDSLTVKELAVEDFESQDTHDESFNNGATHAFSSEVGESIKDGHDEFCDQRAGEESFSEIEAELEAELQKLEINMTSSSLEGKLSDLVELDPDFIPDIAQGELRAEMFGTETGSQPFADRDGSGSSTTHSANYAVSPRELSLRLHQVIQSRLEQRVHELETALQNSQKKAQFLQYRESGSSSTSPVFNGEKTIDRPVVINLSGESLDAYNALFDEFNKMNESEEEQHFQPSDQSSNLVQNGESEDCMLNHSVTEIGLSDDFDTSRDETESGYNEMEKRLIEQIVERARKGSPVVLNAQRMLFSGDESAL